MQALIRLFIDIALHRKGPQDVPTADAVLAITLAAYLAVGAAALLPSVAGPGQLMAQLAADLALAIVVFSGLLVATGRAVRIRQTLAALFGTGALLSAAALPFIWISAGTFDETGPTAGAELPALLSTMALFALLLASLMVTGHILRHSLDWSYAAGVLVAVLYFAASVALFRWLFPGA